MRSSDIHIEMRCIIYCDIVSYTSQCVAARQQKREEGFNAKTARFIALWRDYAASNGTAFMKSLGDGLLATFHDPIAGLHSVLDSVTAVSGDPLCADLCARVGMHVGKVCVQEDGDILGADVALAHRVLTQAEPGQVLLSETCASHLRPYLATTHSLQDVGERRLKGFDNPVRLFRLAGPELAAAQQGVTVDGGHEARVLLVTRDSERYHALAKTLDDLDDVEVTAHVHEVQAAVELTATTNPDVMLIDLEIPLVDVMATIRHVKEVGANTEVLALADAADDARITEALTSGAIGFLLTAAPLEEVDQAIQAARRREARFTEALVALAITKFEQLKSVNKEARSLFSEWNRRERTLLNNLASTLPERAQSVRPIDPAVREQMTSILSKLQINQRSEPVLHAIRNVRDRVTSIHDDQNGK